MDVEKTIREIISMDRKTMDIKMEGEKIANLREKELKETLQSLEKRYLQEGKAKGEAAYKKIIEKGMKEAEELRVEEEKAIKDMENVYGQKKDKIIEKLFHILFDNRE